MSGLLLSPQIYDITSKQSFDELPQIVDQLRSIKADASDSTTPPLKIVVVGNKRDLESSRQVPIQDGMTYAASLGAPFFETSAKEGTNVEESFYDLIRECVRKPGDPGCLVM
jgi:GTPase KRas